MTAHKPTNPKDAVATDKLALHLVSPIVKAYQAIAHYLGQVKYGAWNWRGAGARASIYRAALDRHLDAWWEGEENDPADGTPHLANALACIGILIDAKHAGKLIDDRPPSNHKGLAEVRSQFEALMPKIRERYADKAPKHFTIADTEPKATPFPYIGEDRRVAREDGWSEWDGTGLLYWMTDGLRVDVRLRNGSVYRNQPASKLAWGHRPPGDVDRHADIVAFRKVARLI